MTSGTHNDLLPNSTMRSNRFGAASLLVALVIIGYVAIDRRSGAVVNWETVNEKETLQEAHFDDSLDDEHEDWPPLNDLVHLKDILTNVEWLLQWSIIGHEKTGTTFLNNWLSQQPELAAYFDTEVWEMYQNKPAGIVRKMYYLETGKRRKRGYKAPRDVSNINVWDLYAEYWPKTRLMIGLRHPIEYFESFYNYRAGLKNLTMPSPDKLMGPCQSDLPDEEARARREAVGGDDHFVCTDNTRFHVHLSWMGKSPNVTSDEENALLGPRSHILASKAPVVNPIFLYDQQQFEDDNHERFQTLRLDLQHFLGLERLLRDPPARDSSTANYNPLKKYPLDICRPEYGQLREVLLVNGRNASTWILRYLLPHPEVTVSSPEYFTELLQAWRKDPCDAR